MRGSAQLRRRLALTAALGAAVLLLPGDVTRARRPIRRPGTVTDRSTTVTWSAGPFAVANPTGAAGDSDLQRRHACDDYALHVGTPPGYGAGHQLAISVQLGQHRRRLRHLRARRRRQRRRHARPRAPTPSWCCSRRTPATTPCASCPTCRSASPITGEGRRWSTQAGQPRRRAPRRAPASRNYAAPGVAHRRAQRR